MQLYQTPRAAFFASFRRSPSVRRLRFGAALVVSSLVALPVQAEPTVVKDKHGNIASVEQSGPSTIHSKDSAGGSQKHPVDAGEYEQEDLGIITDEDESTVFEDEQGNVAVIEQDEEPADVLPPAD